MKTSPTGRTKFNQIKPAHEVFADNDKAIQKALQQHHYPRIPQPDIKRCPSCGANELLFEPTEVTCLNCGWCDKII